MCGIAGIVQRHGAVNSSDLQTQARALAHRGPDDVGLLVHENFGLTQTRLSIIDLSGGHQPIVSADGQLAVIANGEIYNFVELRAELEAQGCVFATRSDSETILHAYAVYGEEFVSRLHGMFAFCLLDKRRGLVMLGRDRLGIKPLFYALAGERLLFASELKGILALLPQTPAIAPGALYQYLQSQFNTGEETIFQGIRRLAPGTTMTVDRELRASHRRYWTATATATRVRTFDEAVEEFEPLMATVMREHVRSDVPYGLFLSGGVDSAVLLALLSRYQDQPVRTFSIGYAAEQLKGELDDAGFIARELGSVHTPIELDWRQVFHRLPFTVWAADDLMRDHACLPTSFLAQRAAQELKVVFSGEGGDEVFAGYGRYRKGALERFFQNLLSPGSGGFRTHGQLHPLWSRRIFAPPLRAASAAMRRPFVAAWQETPAAWSALQRSQYTDLVTAMPDNLLVKADRMLMAFGVEGRVPFLDHRIVEFGLSLPDELKVGNGQGKLFLKQWAERMIPREHLYRKKRGFHVPIGEWLNAAFLDRLEERLLQSRAMADWFEPQALQQLFAAQRRHGKLTRDIWSLMQFAIWYRLFVVQPGVAPSPDEDPLEWIG